MPLTSSGQKVLGSMTKQYGSEKGERVFYASMNKGNPGSTKWHGAAPRKLTAPGRSMSGKR